MVGVVEGVMVGVMEGVGAGTEVPWLAPLMKPLADRTAIMRLSNFCFNTIASKTGH